MGEEFEMESGGSGYGNGGGLNSVLRLGER